MKQPTTAEADRVLDVRDIDGEPFDDIVAALDSLPENQTLLLVNSFEPKPLYNVLDQRGFAHDAAEVEPDVWHVEIEHA